MSTITTSSDRGYRFERPGNGWLYIWANGAGMFVGRFDPRTRVWDQRPYPGVPQSVICEAEELAS